MEWDRLQLHLRTQIRKDAIKTLPEYTVGHREVVLVENQDVEAAVNEIAKSKIIGFDTESRPTFNKGDTTSVSLIQLVTADTCYLFHKQKIPNMFAALKPIFESVSITKVGSSLESDKAMLRKHYSIEFMNLLDTTLIFRALGKSKGTLTGAKQMVAVVLNKKLKKSKSISTSNWSKLPYHPAQIRYASEDAAAPLDCYQHLLGLFRVHDDRLPGKLLEVIQRNL